MLRGDRRLERVEVGLPAGLREERVALDLAAQRERRHLVHRPGRIGDQDAGALVEQHLEHAEERAAIRPLPR